MHATFMRPGYGRGLIPLLIRDRLMDEINTMTASAGPLRSGKSVSQQSLGEEADANGWQKEIQNGVKVEDIPPHLLIPQADGGYKVYDPCFDHKHITFLPQDYLKAIRNARPGCYIIFDEPGAEWSARRFMSIKNQLLNSTHITFGSKLVNVGWAVPVLQFQDINSVRLVNYLFLMTLSKRGSGRFYQNWVNPRTGKWGSEKKGWVHFYRPFQDRPEETKEYLEMKRQYQDSSYEKYYAEFEKSDKSEKGVEDEEKKVDLDKIVKEILTHVDDFKTPRGTVNASMVQLYYPELKTFQRVAVKALVERDLQKQRLAAVQKKEGV